MIGIVEDFNRNNPPLAGHVDPLWSCRDQLNGGYRIEQWSRIRHRDGDLCDCGQTASNCRKRTLIDSIPKVNTSESTRRGGGENWC